MSFDDVGNGPDLYPDLSETFRLETLNNNPSGRRDIVSNWASDRMRGERNPAVHKLNFIKKSCQIS